MLRAVHERLRMAYPEALFTMVPTALQGSAPFRRLVDAGFYPKASLYRYGVDWGQLCPLIPRTIRERFGLVLDREVDIVIDAAGFAYSDQWGISHTQVLAESARRWRRRGTKVVVMPQALGPFRGTAIRKHIQTVVDHADLVMPRERTSYDHLVDVVGERSNIRQFPDFTNLIEGRVPPVFDEQRHQVCLVPNYRMIDKTDAAVSEAYLPFMQRCAKLLVGRGAMPFVLVHEGAKDQWLADQIASAAGGIPVLTVDDPLEIKGILGACRATIGSRFHGLVSALSQGVPSLATGWSHKYVELLDDYGFPEGVVSVVGEDGGALEDRLEMLVDPERHAKLRATLLENSERLKQRSEEMWATVFGVLESSRAG